jgi:hypothetical protein
MRLGKGAIYLARTQGMKILLGAIKMKIKAMFSKTI